LVATAERENRRYIAVVMGADKIEIREKEAMQLLDYGFNNFITVRLFNKDEILSHLSVLKGVKGEVGLMPSEDGVITIPPSLTNCSTKCPIAPQPTTIKVVFNIKPKRMFLLTRL
jgi:D-alanyl-D-alanine carboxypeptidase (penicillin-binding protein 5/6)